mgnify:CR=1 FL=1
MANTYLSRTFSNATNRKKWTISLWLKRGAISGDLPIVSGDSSVNKIHFLNSNNTLDIVQWSGSYQYRLRTSRVFRDTSAWYHLVIAVDTTLNTADNRVRLYVNGVEETSFADRTNPSQNFDTSWNDSNVNLIGKEGSNYFDGSMSHFHFIDGTAYNATAFGETDATTGEWVGKTSPSVTYGTNGFFILKDGNGITDQSGEGNDFTLGGGTLTDLKDNPDNVFATLNPLNQPHSDYVLTQGNNTITLGGGTEKKAGSATIGVASGKFYWEVKLLSQSAETYCTIGISGASNLESGTAGSQSTDYLYRGQNGTLKNNGGSTSYGATWGVGNIIGVALDCTSAQNTLTFYKDGASQGAINITSVASTPNGVYLPTSGKEASATPVFNFNFGNGYFGTTAITTNSGNGYSGAEGASKFNYTVPSGYSALTTKGLNE